MKKILLINVLLILLCIIPLHTLCNARTMHTALENCAETILALGFPYSQYTELIGSVRASFQDKLRQFPAMSFIQAQEIIHTIVQSKFDTKTIHPFDTIFRPYCDPTKIQLLDIQASALAYITMIWVQQEFFHK